MSYVNDQMIMVEVIKSKKGNLVAKDVIMPGVIASPENRSKTDTYAAFISDLHIGSKFFMENEFAKFIDWLSSPDPKARKVRFLIIGRSFGWCGNIQRSKQRACMPNH